MQNDSIESLLLRHYGSAAQSPVGLEENLRASFHAEVEEIHKQEQVAFRLRQRRMSRRQVIRLVAMGTTGLSILSLGLESLHELEVSLVGQDATRPAYS